MQLADTLPSPLYSAEPAPAPESQTTQTFQQCDECAAPVDAEQRYCVSCGAHRPHVNDPAARHLSHASARSRTSRAASTARTTVARTRSRGIGVALAIALIPVAAAVGVVAGRSSNSQDSALIRELEHRQAVSATTTVPATTASTSAATTGSTASRHHARAAKSSTASTKNAGKVLSKTSNGTAQQITGFKPSQSQEQQGAQETQKVQKSTGKNYVNGQNNLPSQVVVP